MSEELNELLRSWNVLEIYPLLKEEGIDLAELRIMRCHHMMELMQVFKMSIRIRFEHELEKWRREQNLPSIHGQSAAIVTSSHQCSSGGECLSHHSATGDDRTLPGNRRNLKRKFVTINMDRDDIAAVNVATPSGNYENISIINPEKWLGSVAPTTSSQPNGPRPATTIPLVAKPIQVRPTVPFRNISRPFGSLPRIPRSNCPQPNTIKVLTILLGSAKGKSILDYYYTHGILSSAHRSMIITLIADFFDNNDIYLTLQMSHRMEEQIIKLFPTERLEQYRTEKRGRLYIKFNNLKRYRRDKLLVSPNRVSTSNPDGTTTTTTTTNNVGESSFDQDEDDNLNDGSEGDSGEGDNDDVGNGNDQNVAAIRVDTQTAKETFNTEQMFLEEERWDTNSVKIENTDDDLN